jgi:hypothetical protein
MGSQSASSVIACPGPRTRSLFSVMQHSPFIRLGKVIVSASDTLPKDDILRKAVVHLFAQIGLCLTAAYRSLVTLRLPTIFIPLNEP